MTTIHKKHCNGCNRTKPVSLFYKNKTRKDGLDTWCKDCSNAYSKAHYHRNGDRRREQMARSRAKRCIEDVKVAFERILSKGRIDADVTQLIALYDSCKECRYCGVSLAHDCVSIDHKIPLCRGGPRTIENLAICCFDCNLLKWKRTDQEFEVFLVEYCKRFNRRKPSDDRGQAGASIPVQPERLSEKTPIMGDATV